MIGKIENTHKSNIKEYFLNEDVYVAQINNNTPYTDTLTQNIDKRFIQFHFCTKGNMTFRYNEGAYKINLTDGYSFLIFNPSIDLPLDLSIKADSKVCIVLVSLEMLHKLFADNNVRADFLRGSKGTGKYYAQQPISTVIRMVLNQIENHSLSPHFQCLYILGKVYELFTLYFSESENMQKENCPFLDNEKDARKLKEAREILLNDLTNPPTVKELSNLSGLTEYKLKEGFKQVYGTTVYGFVLDKKMEIAREKLESSDVQVKEIAFDLGYENPSHFIAAFKKKYGVTPKQFAMKN